MEGGLEDTSTMDWMLGRCARFLGLTYVRESNLCLSGIDRISPATNIRYFRFKNGNLD